MLIILLVATALFVLAWFYLLPHYNGNDYTFWIGKTYTRRSPAIVDHRDGSSTSHVTSRRAPIVEEEHREAHPFIPASSFQGAKPGYVFKSDRSGLGYYRDDVDEIREKPRVRFSSQNQMHNYRSGEPPNYVKKGV